MQTIEKTFLSTMELFKRLRIKMCENRYKIEIKDYDTEKRFDETHGKLLELLDDEGKLILLEYTDLLIVKYGHNPSWFYDCGLNDGHALHSLFKSILDGSYDIPPLEEKSSVDLSEEIDRLINMS